MEESSQDVSDIEKDNSNIFSFNNNHFSDLSFHKNSHSKISASSIQRTTPNHQNFKKSNFTSNEF